MRTKTETGLELIKQYLAGDKLVLVDVGARGGISSRWQRFFPVLKVIGFEPDASECEKINLNAKSAVYDFMCFPYALGQHANTTTSLHICKSPGCTSVYEPNLEFVSDFYYASNMIVVDKKEIALNTIDNICKTENIKPDCVKIDTQGYELEIMKGAANLLQQVKFLELEVEFNPQYKEQPLFSDVDIFLRNNGFLLLGLRRTVWRRRIAGNFPKSRFGGQIMHGDVIYYNADLLDKGRLAPVKELIKFCIIFSAYKQDDFISHLLSHPCGHLNTLSERERRLIAEVLRNPTSSISSILAALLNLIARKLRLPHKSMRRIIDRFQSPSAVDWHDPDFF